MKSVSICIPCYNQVQYLKHTLDSVIAQDYKDMEVIICDDSTTNEVESLVIEFNLRTEKKIFYHKNNPSLGPSANWNYCIKKASHDWIKILHHDDWFTSNNSLSAFMMLASEEIPFLFSSAVSYNVRDELKSDHIPPKSFLNKIKDDPTELFLHNLIGPPSSVMFNKKSAVFFDERMKWLVDIDFYIRMLNFTNRKFIFIDETLITSVNHASHNVTNFSNNASTELYEYYLLYSKLLQNYGEKKECAKRLNNLNKKYNIISYSDLKSYLRDVDFSEIQFNELQEPFSLRNLFFKIKSKLKNVQ